MRQSSSEKQPSLILPVDSRGSEKDEIYEFKNAKLYQNEAVFEISASLVQYSDSEVAAVHIDWSKQIEGNKTEIDLGKAMFTSKSNPKKIQLHVVSMSRHLAIAHPAIKIHFGSDHPIDFATFHISSFPRLRIDNPLIGQINGEDFEYSEYLFAVEGWQIRIQRQDAVRSGGSFDFFNLVGFGVGSISRTDGKQFKRRNIVEILRALELFFQFSFGQDCRINRVVGSNQVTLRSCGIWQNFNEKSGMLRCRSWVIEEKGECLASAFLGFVDLWKEPDWKEPLETAIAWLVESYSTNVSVEGAIAFAQIPLEMLAWLVFVDRTEIVISDEFGKLSGASKLQLLLDKCGISIFIPSEMRCLSKLAVRNSIPSGPVLATKVRNLIVHPDKSNRERMSEWKKQGFDINEIHIETLRLFNWYLTAVVLNRIGYKGECMDWRIPTWKNVPWSEVT